MHKFAAWFIYTFLLVRLTLTVAGNNDASEVVSRFVYDGLGMGAMLLLALLLLGVIDVTITRHKEEKK